MVPSVDASGNSSVAEQMLSEHVALAVLVGFSVTLDPTSTSDLVNREDT